ncbi:MarR family transcriptional regulator [Amycolatopsis cynarae]|uniref:MarR family transcriptional regulator n=1 Tax=Amycolatopsis cynarae TaxID=2995223 RepID=A0ABY7BAE5_9PSEU|nr:MarR family transcriptional regulator [Amycolatopsis sp. HUAS 11-8]WAL68909.1 MarR family transcriptional regulator [Amycolatopsis sp. HUAS 11-8]
MDGDLELALAVRALVVATEQFRTQQARTRLGVSPTEMIALGILHVEGPQTITALARLLAITPASTTELADRLARDGHVERLPHPADRRKRLLRLTPAAAGMLTGIYEELSLRLAGLASREDRPAVLAFLRSATAAVAGRPHDQSRAV